MTGALWRLGAVVLGGILCCAVSGVFGASPASADQDLDVVYDGLDLASTQAKYVVLLDVSGSVRDRFPEVRKQLKALLGAVGPGDEVVVFPFDQRVRREIVLGGPRDVDRLKAPKGRWTDIGAALDQAVTWLDRHPPRLAAIMLASDGEHDPGPDSGYREAGAWDALAERAAALEEKLDWLRVYAFPFPADRRKGEKVRAAQKDVLAKVFPRHLVHEPRDADEKADLAAVKELARKEFARGTLTAEQERGVTAEWVTAPGALDVMSGGGTARLRLRSTYRYIPVRISGLTVPVAESGDFQVKARPADGAPLSLRPGDSADIDVTLEWSPPSPELLDRRVHAGQRAVVEAQVTSPWSKGLAKLPIRPPPPGLGSPPLRLFPAGETQVTGIWRLLAGFGGATTALAVFLVFGLRMRNAWRPKLYGHLSFMYWEHDPETGPVARQGKSVPLDGRRGPHTVYPLDDADGTAAAPPVNGAANGRPAATVSGRGLLSGRRLLITFSRDGTQAESTSIPYWGSALIGGVLFTHREKPDEEARGR